MPTGSFHVRITITNPRRFAMISERLRGGFKEMFQAIIERWQEHNEAKFEAAQGASQSGVSFGAGLNWLPLTDEYFAEKSKEYDDWIMVADGSLLESLTNPGAPGWNETVMDTAANFGSVLPHGNYDWVVEARPVQFLDDQDQAMIAAMVKGFIEGRPPFMPYEKTATKVLDREYHDVVNAV